MSYAYTDFAATEPVKLAPVLPGAAADATGITISALGWGFQLCVNQR